MFKLWRREASKSVAPDLHSKKKQAQFMELLSQAIKTVRKKQEFYTRILFIQMTPLCQFIYSSGSENQGRSSVGFSVRQHTSYSGFGNTQTLNPNDKMNINPQLWKIQSQFEGYICEQEQIIEALKVYDQEPFFLSKKFLYSMFVRMLEIFQFARQGVGLRQKNDERIFCRNWQKIYDENKTSLAQCYQNLVYLQNYNVFELATLVLKKQNQRICSILPSKVKKNQVALKPIIRLNSTQFRKTQSIEIKPIKKDDIADLITKKLTFKQKKKKLLTQKRVEERKKPKQKPLTMKSLYGILNVRIPKIEQGYGFRRQMQMDTLQRNQQINEDRKKWQKKFQQKVTSIKNMDEL